MPKPWEYDWSEGSDPSGLDLLPIVPFFGRIRPPMLGNDGSRTVALPARSVPLASAPVLDNAPRQRRVVDRSRGSVAASDKSRATTVPDARPAEILHPRQSGDIALGQRPSYAEQEIVPIPDDKIQALAQWVRTHRPPGTLSVQDLEKQFEAFTGRPTTNAPQVVRQYNQHGIFVADVDYDRPQKVDISDARGGSHPIADAITSALVNQGAGTPVRAEQLDALFRGTANGVTLGADDWLSAAANTALNGRSFRDNLRREHAIDEYDEEHNFPERTIGEVGGGLMLPETEARSALDVAKVAGQRGAVHGFLSSDGDLGDRFVGASKEAALNTLTGMALREGYGRLGQGYQRLRARFGPEPEPAPVPIIQGDRSSGRRSRSSGPPMLAPPGRGARNVAGVRDATTRAVVPGSPIASAPEGPALARSSPLAQGADVDVLNRLRNLPEIRRWALAYSKIAAHGNRAALFHHIDRLQQLAERYPQLEKVIMETQKELISSAAKRQIDKLGGRRGERE